MKARQNRIHHRVQGLCLGILLGVGSISSNADNLVIDGAVIVSNNMTVVSHLVIGGSVAAPHAVFNTGASIGGMTLTNGTVQDVQSIQLGDLDLISHEGDTNFLYVVNGTSTGRVAILWE